MPTAQIVDHRAGAYHTVDATSAAVAKRSSARQALALLSSLKRSSATGRPKEDGDRVPVLARLSTLTPCQCLRGSGTMPLSRINELSAGVMGAASVRLLSIEGACRGMTLCERGIGGFLEPAH
jgi:hypothetical protein